MSAEIIAIVSAAIMLSSQLALVTRRIRSDMRNFDERLRAVEAKLAYVDMHNFDERIRVIETEHAYVRGVIQIDAPLRLAAPPTKESGDPSPPTSRRKHGGKRR